jgi:hypothetical protein
MNEYKVLFKDVEMTKLLQDAGMIEPSRVAIRGTLYGFESDIPIDGFRWLFTDTKIGDISVSAIAILNKTTGELWKDESVQSVNNVRDWNTFDGILKINGMIKEEMI